MSAVPSIALVLLPVVALVVWALAVRRDAEQTDAEPSRPPACPVQLLFVAQVAGTQLLADGVLLDAAWSETGLVPPGTPVTLRVRLPRDELVAGGMVGVLRGWADDAAVIEARFRDDADVVRAQLSRDAVRLLVDVDDVVLAPRPAA